MSGQGSMELGVIVLGKGFCIFQQVRTVNATTSTDAPPGSKGVQGGITAEGHGCLVLEGGIYREDYQPHQPPVAFHAPESGRKYCSNQQGP